MRTGGGGGGWRAGLGIRRHGRHLSAAAAVTASVSGRGQLRLRVVCHRFVCSRVGRQLIGRSVVGECGACARRFLSLGFGARLP